MSDSNASNENPDSEWLGDGDGYDFDDPELEENAEQDADVTDGQFILLKSQIVTCQEEDRICYIVWEGSEDIPPEAEIIYPTDSDAYINKNLLYWKAARLHDIEITTEWPDVPVRRLATKIKQPPSIVEHFCHSRRARSIECFDDIISMTEGDPDLKHRVVHIAECLLVKYQKAPLMVEKVHTLVVDLLLRGGEYSRMAESFLVVGGNNYLEFVREFSTEEVKDATAIGKCRTDASSFHMNTLIQPSNITCLDDLQFVIEGEAKEIREYLYKLYLESLRFTTSDAVIQNVVIPLYESNMESIRDAAAKTLFRLGYGFMPNGDSFAWKRRAKERVS